jgi:ubiquinone/menaquinone biosynthesis C-methylase UbiE
MGDSRMVLQNKPEDDWDVFGKIDPYFGVISNARFKSSVINDQDRNAFFSTGVAHVDKLLHVLHSRLGLHPQGTALDFGCGVGRIANALAVHFDQVVGLDISPGMLAEARRVTADQGISNVIYDSSLNPERLQAGAYDFVHTYIVLQHIPVATGEGIIRDMLRSTKIGGAGAIHFTYGYSKNPHWSMVKNYMKRFMPVRIAANALSGKPILYPAMQMNVYSVPRIIEIFEEYGAEIRSVVRIDDWGNLGIMLFFTKGESGNLSNLWSNPAR